MTTLSFIVTLLLPVIALEANVISQIIVYRIVTRSLLRSVMAGFILGLVGLLLLELFIRHHDPFWSGIARASADVIIYAAFGYCYFHFVNLGETARRFRLMWELYESPAGLSREELLRRYNAAGIMEVRIGRLVKNGQIRFEQGRYYLNPSMMMISSRIMTFVKKLVFGRSEMPSA